MRHAARYQLDKGLWGNEQTHSHTWAHTLESSSLINCRPQFLLLLIINDTHNTLLCTSIKKNTLNVP